MVLVIIIENLYLGKETYNDILFILNELEKEKFPFYISYTLTKLNHNSYKKDIIWLINKFKYLKRIILNIAYNHLEDQNIFINKNELEYFAEAILMKYNKPICEFSCRNM